MAQSIDKAGKRDKARNKRKNGMRTSGKSVFVIQTVLNNKTDKARKSRKKKKGGK